jgi:hypothetical protein
VAPADEKYIEPLAGDERQEPGEPIELTENGQVGEISAAGDAPSNDVLPSESQYQGETDTD